MLVASTKRRKPPVSVFPAADVFLGVGRRFRGVKLSSPCAFIRAASCASPDLPVKYRSSADAHRDLGPSGRPDYYIYPCTPTPFVPTDPCFCFYAYLLFLRQHHPCPEQCPPTPPSSRCSQSPQRQSGPTSSRARIPTPPTPSTPSTTPPSSMPQLGARSRAPHSAPAHSVSRTACTTHRAAHSTLSPAGTSRSSSHRTILRIRSSSSASSLRAQPRPPANPVYTPAELAYQYRDCGARLVFTVPDALPAVFAMLKLVGVGEAEAKRRVVVMQYDGSGKRGTGKGVDRDVVWLEELLAQGEEHEEEKFDGAGAHETAYLCYSSGTTGKPKGVMARHRRTGNQTTHKNMVIETQILRAAFPLLASGPGKDVLVGVLPLFHIYGLALLLHMSFVSGAPTVIMPRFDPEQFCSNIARYRVTIGLIVPPIFLALVNHPATTRHDISSLRFICSAAAPLSRDLALAAVKKLASVGYGLTETSPATHMVPIEWAPRKIGSCGALVPNVEAKLVLTEDEATGEAKEEAAEWDPNEEERGGAGVKMSGRGELWVRGPIVMKVRRFPIRCACRSWIAGAPCVPGSRSGRVEACLPSLSMRIVRVNAGTHSRTSHAQGYLNNPTATRAAISPSGWFKTGDILVRDADGFWYVVDRKKELIKYKVRRVCGCGSEWFGANRDDPTGCGDRASKVRSGFTTCGHVSAAVAPAELEALLLTHPKLVDAAVIGINDPVQATELPRAYVVPRSSPDPASAAAFDVEIQAWVAQRVAPHKRLRGGIVVIPEIPKSAAGKILRRELRERAKKEDPRSAGSVVENPAMPMTMAMAKL
ncbi:hypothetical protein EVG20_g7251 [Dentipellis fragilis]|uniref:AMP-dependent synthetase/ligase domain-containing protein n=1 Tax=Dentipellis fragilis TaxID=205917 RepID=A0A4Y9YIX3_9AGAM|nr:hypothetical protein EVG20_g7251 [Dentipellis fragilis]